MCICAWSGCSSTERSTMLINEAGFMLVSIVGSRHKICNLLFLYFFFCLLYKCDSEKVFLSLSHVDDNNILHACIYRTRRILSKVWRNMWIFTIWLNCTTYSQYEYLLSRTVRPSANEFRERFFVGMDECYCIQWKTWWLSVYVLLGISSGCQYSFCYTPNFRSVWNIERLCIP